MHSLRSVVLCLLLWHCAAPCQAADAFERISPAQAGYSEEGLHDLRALLQRSGSESMLLVHRGRVFFEWGDIRQKRLVHSMRKPLLHALLGIELERGCLQLDQTLAHYGIEERPPGLTPAEQHATLKQLLQSRSGVYYPAAAESESMAMSRPARGSRAPGEHYYYNNWDFNVAGAIYERCAARDIHEAFATEVAAPLGMLDYQGRVMLWPPDEAEVPPQADGFRSLEPAKSRYRAYHFRMSAHDLALFGQLYLDHGRWQGRQLLPAAWIDESTRPISVLDERYGLAYGQLWDVLVPAPGETRPAFFHTGLGVHMLGVYPRHELVMVHRVDTERAFELDEGDLYRIIRAMHAARLPAAGP
jgi:CubicO group peptidase (beta-lactamase class C family)